MNEARYGRRDPADTIYDRLGPAPPPEVIVPVVVVKLSTIKKLFRRIFRK